MTPMNIYTGSLILISSHGFYYKGIRFHSFRKEPLIEKNSRVKLGLRREKRRFPEGKRLSFPENDKRRELK